MIRLARSAVLALLVACGPAKGGGSSSETGGGSTATGSGPGETSSGEGESASVPTEGSDVGGEATGTTVTGETGAATTGETGVTATGGTAATDDTGSTTAEAPPRPGVLIYRGNGGAAPFGAYWRFDVLSERLTAAGKSVTDTDQWPGSFADVGLVLLVINAEPFSAAQVADLEAVLAGGGVVVVANEWSNYAESENLGALLGALGSGLAFEDALVADGGGGTVTVDGVADHPLMADVASIVVAAGSKVLGCADGRALLTVGDECLMAAEAHGPGLLLAFGDTDILDDHALTAADETQNFAFLAHVIAALP